MSELFYDGHILKGVDEKGKEKIFLDYYNLKENKSKIPAHSLIESTVDLSGEGTIFDYLLKLSDRFNQLTDNNNRHMPNVMLFFDLFIANIIYKTPLPVKVCRIGDDGGILSWHIAEVVGKFNPNSTVCFVNDSTDNAPLLDALSFCKSLPRVSIIAADFCDTNLQGDDFDLVIINSTADFHDPPGVMKEAKRLIKHGGTILCYTQNNPSVEEAFKSSFKNFDEYYIIPELNILQIVYDKNSCPPEYDFKGDVKILTDEIYMNIKNNNKMDIATFNWFYKRLKKLIAHAVKIHDFESKKTLIHTYEALADYKISLK